MNRPTRRKSLNVREALIKSTNAEAKNSGCSARGEELVHSQPQATDSELPYLHYLIPGISEVL